MPALRLLWSLLALLAGAAQAQPIVAPVDPFILQILNERDRQYAQRFDAQEKGTALALAAQEKGTALALTAIKELTAFAFAAAKEAVDKANTASEKRFDSVNEFRNTLKDQQALLVTKSEIEIRFRAFADVVTGQATQIAALTASRDQAVGSSQGINWLVGLGGTVMGLFFGVIAAIATIRRTSVVAR